MTTTLSLAAIHVLWVAACFWGLSIGVWLPMGAAAVVATALWFKRFAQRPLRLRPRADDVGVGLLAGAALSGATLLFYPLLADVVPSLSEETAALYARLNVSPGPVKGFAVFVLIIVAEELVWRDAMVRALRARGHARSLAYALSTLAYALAQSGQLSVTVVLVAFSVGVPFAGLAYARGGRLAAPIAAHVVWDVAVMVLWPLEMGPAG